MAFQRLRRALMVVALGSAALVAGCGGGNVYSTFRPSRVVAFGDAFGDLGQTGKRYTINDGSINIWSQQLAANYGLGLTTAASGGTSYATANARVVAKPDAIGDASTPTVKEQVDAFLAQGSFNDKDLVVIGAGIADIVAEVAKLNSGAQTDAQTQANLKQAGADLGAQVRRVADSGANHVVVTGSYNLGRSPWAAATGQAAALQKYSSAFNESLLISLSNFHNRVLYVDVAYYYNLVTGSPGGYSLDNAVNPVCNSVDPGPGIGIGAGQVSSALCNSGTLNPGIDPARFLFADAIYPTPQGHRLFGNYAYDRARQQW